MSELLFPQSAHEYEVERVTRALRDELPEAEPQGLRERAGALCAIREHFDVPFEVLIGWAHAHAPAKEWSCAEFRGFCEWYVEERKKEQKEP